MKAAIAALGLVATACSSPATFPVGQWEFTAEVTGEEAGGTPVDAAPIPSGDETFRLCVTPQQTANLAEMILPRTVPNSCKFSKSSFAKGMIAVDGNCIMDGSFARQHVTMEGSFSASGMSATIVSVRPGAVIMVDPNAGSDLKTFYQVRGRRTGDCPM